MKEAAWCSAESRRPRTPGAHANVNAEVVVLRSIHEKRRFRRRRESSFNPTGGNADSVKIEPGESHSVPPLRGPGIVRHLWLTVNGRSADIYREILLCATFDDAFEPQVRLPLADFFLFGHGTMVDVNSAPVQVSRQPHIDKLPYRGSLNCMFPMPFASQASLSFLNTGGSHVRLFYYVDWDSHQTPADSPLLHFHATLNEEQTALPAGQKSTAHGRSQPADFCNRDWVENYVFLDLDGYEGHYVGTALNVNCRPDGAGKWWEGDDMFVIDGEDWPPRLHGTGTEDYFNLAWGFRRVDCRPEYGVTFLDPGDDAVDPIDGRFSMYRFHLSDPIPFERSLLATIEHGHANDCEAHYRSVAYWYGRPR